MQIKFINYGMWNFMPFYASRERWIKNLFEENRDFQILHILFSQWESDKRYFLTQVFIVQYQEIVFEVTLLRASFTSIAMMITYKQLSRCKQPSKVLFGSFHVCTAKYCYKLKHNSLTKSLAHQDKSFDNNTRTEQL